MVEFADRATGAILGMAIGDALGAVVEGLHAQRIADWFGQLRDFDQARDFYQSLNERTDLPDRVITSHRQRWRMPGLYTDDTQQALLLIESLVESGKADRHDYAHRIIECLKASESLDLPLGLFRGCGPGFREIARRLLSGQSPDATGVDSAGNGASMRIAPVGLFSHDDPLEAGRGAVSISVLTHRDCRAILAAASIAMAVSLASERICIDSRRGFFQELIDLVRQISVELADHPMLKDSPHVQLGGQYIEAMENLKPHLGDSYSHRRHGGRSLRQPGLRNVSDGGVSVLSLLGSDEFLALPALFRFLRRIDRFRRQCRRRHRHNRRDDRRNGRGLARQAFDSRGLAARTGESPAGRASRQSPDCEHDRSARLETIYRNGNSPDVAGSCPASTAHRRRSNALVSPSAKIKVVIDENFI